MAFADRDATRGRGVAAEIAAEGGKAHFVEADVGQEAICLAFIQQALQQFGRLNVLVNNAGIRMYQTVVEATAESWDEILSVNLKSYAYCAKGAIPAMRQAGGGSIVNVASVRSIVAGGNNIQYDTTKHAVAGLTRGLAGDHGAEGIRVNAVCPGPIFTPFHARRLQNTGKTVAQYNEDAASRTMLKASRYGRRGCGMHPLPGVKRRVVCHRVIIVRRWRNDRDVGSAPKRVMVSRHQMGISVEDGTLQ